MSFAVFTREMDDLEQVVLEDTNSKTRIEILPAYGALLHSFTINTGEGSINVIENYKNLSSLQEGINQSFRSCKLSPFVCRISKAHYTHDGISYNFDNKSGDGSAIHGLLYDKPFKVVNVFSDDGTASVQLKYIYDKEDAGYPFLYRCEIVYTLLPQNTLLIETTVINLDDKTIPIADGWHPYFTPGGITDQWMLSFKSESIVELDERLIPTGRLTPYVDFNEEKLIGKLELDSCFLMNMEGGYAVCTLFNPENKISISLFADRSYPYLVIYTPPHRKSIAIENLSAPPDCLNNKRGLVLLSPGNSKTFTVTYRVTSG